MKRFIYADHAATTQLDPIAFEAMKPWLTEEYGNASQLYSFSRKPRHALNDAREIIAKCLNADKDEIFYTSGGTESDNWALKGTAPVSDRKGVLLTSAFEHHAVLHAAEALEMRGYPVAYIYPTDDGIITPEILEEYITDDTRMVSVMMANNELGTIQPINELCNIAHEHGAVFHTDAVQAVGHIPIDVKESRIDLLSASAHKFNGPKGIGFLYIRKGTEIHPLLDGGSQEGNLRGGTENVASIVGMAVALEQNCKALVDNMSYVKVLENRLLNALHEADIIYCRNGNGTFLPGVISLSFPGYSGEAILHRMDLMNIAISTGSACNSVSTEISHVLKAIRLDEITAKGTIRISLGKDNTEEDVRDIVSALARILK